jgi:dnd system-associated protein 4
VLERRIAYSKDKSEVIRRLQSAEDSTGPFALIADVLVFAAALGIRRNRRSSLAEPLAEPIRQSVFDRQGYDTMMNLIALHADPRAAVLADSDDAVIARARAFEEYANGGLEVLQEEIRGARDVLEMVVLMINAERSVPDEGSGVFELAKLIEGPSPL